MEALDKLEAIFAQCPDWKTSKQIVHMPVAHPDRDPTSKDAKLRTLTLEGVTWAELHDLIVDYKYLTR